MRKVVAHLIITLDGVVKFDVVADTIGKQRDTEEVLADFFAEVAEEDAILLGRVTYQEWADYWPTSTVSHSPAILTTCQSMWYPRHWIPPRGERGRTQRWSEGTSPMQS